MDVYQTKKRIVLSFSERKKRRYIEVAFGDDAIIRRRLMQEQGIIFEDGKAYLPADNFVLSEFFDQYVSEAFIDYSAIKDIPMQSKSVRRPELPYGYLEKLQQMRYSDHTVRVYTTYFKDFQTYFKETN